jgi:Spy/CpxP family protein refolding chaperone
MLPLQTVAQVLMGKRQAALKVKRPGCSELSGWRGKIRLSAPALIMNKISGKVILYAALIFLAGATTGALVAPMIGRTFMQPPRPEQMSRHMLEHLQSGLHLTAEQTAKIKPLIEQTGADMETIHRETMKRVLARIGQTHAQISLLLTPEQRAEFIKMEAEHRKHFGHEHLFVEPPGLPPPEPK